MIAFRLLFDSFNIHPPPHTPQKKVIGTGYYDSNAFYDPDYYNQDVVRNAARMRQNQKQTQQLPQNPQQSMQMQQNRMMGGPNGPRPMGQQGMMGQQMGQPMNQNMQQMGQNMQQNMQNLPGQQNKQNPMVSLNYILFLLLIVALSMRALLS